jgi:hypothetical protein
MIAFIGPAGGSVGVSARLLRQGKSVTFVEAEVSGEKGLATKITFGFGASRESQLDSMYAEAHGKPGPENFVSAEQFDPKAAVFAQHLERRKVQGGDNFSGSDQVDNFIWVRHRDRNALNAAAFLAIADSMPPAVAPA